MDNDPIRARCRNASRADDNQQPPNSLAHDVEHGKVHIKSPSSILQFVRVAGIPSWAQRELKHHLNEPARLIAFCRPGYDSPHNVLFRLSTIEPEIDPETGNNTNRLGVHHDTARLACAILANNAWEGYLTADSPTGPMIPIDNPKRILTRDRYYFHHPSYSGSQSDSKYPIVANFESWQSPTQLPSNWASLGIPPLQRRLQAAQSPRYCAVTGRHMPREAAHLIPLSQTL